MIASSRTDGAAQSLMTFSRLAFSISWALVSFNISEAHDLFTRPRLFSVAVGGAAYPVGAIILLPVAAAIAMLAGCWLQSPSRSWRWGRIEITLPVVALGALALMRSWPVHQLTVLVPSAGGVLLFWGVYVYTLQNWPSRWAVLTLASLIALQGGVAVAQFVHQRSIGLTFLGELVLDPAVYGVSVLEVAGERWLRAYGLLPHPNVLGGVAGLGLLASLGALLQDSRRQWLWIPVLAAGAGLLTSFSRSAWLGTLVGLLYLAGVTHLWRRVQWRERRTLWTTLGLLVVAGGIAVTFGGFLGARLLRSDSLLEHNSVAERIRDAGQAWMLVRHLPLTGVGTGYYEGALWAWADATGQSFPAFQRVHNVPLLLGAEMGVVAAILWLWLVTVPPFTLLRAARSRPAQPALAGWAAALLCLLIVGLLDCYPYFLNFRAGALLGALCGIWARLGGEGFVEDWS